MTHVVSVMLGHCFDLIYLFVSYILFNLSHDYYIMDKFSLNMGFCFHRKYELEVFFSYEFSKERDNFHCVCKTT